MKINELLERQAELKRQGNALWEKAMQETEGMAPEAKDTYMVEVCKADLDIRAALKAINEQIEAARLYQEEERQEITRTMGHQNGSGGHVPSNRNEFTSFDQMLQARYGSRQENAWASWAHRPKNGLINRIKW